MRSSPGVAPDASPGRPSEIEERLNLALIHPLSRRLATILIPTRVTPNMVSAGGVIVAGVAAAAYTIDAWPWWLAALLGFVLHLGWHVVDGADGDLARRTGKSSPTGEIVDGVCDYLSHVVVYVVLAMLLSGQLDADRPGPHIGGWAWLLASAAGLSRAVQANHYESSRRTYLWWVYDKPWIRQDLQGPEGSPATGLGTWLRTNLGGAYLAISRLVSPEDAELVTLRSRLVAGGDGEMVRRLYVGGHRPLLKLAAWLGALHETQAIFVSMLLGSPLYVFVYELVVLNGIMLVSIGRQKRANAALEVELAALDKGRPAETTAQQAPA